MTWPYNPMRKVDGTLNISWDQFRKDVLSNDKFLEVFSDLSKEIIKFRKAPGCSPCARVLNKIANQKNKLIEIYNDTVNILPPTGQKPEFKRSDVIEQVHEEELYDSIDRIGKAGGRIITIVPSHDGESYYILYRKTIRNK